MGRPERPFYVAEIDGAFIATAGARKMADEEDWMIVGVYVSPEYRGRGIAKTLIQRVIEDVGERGAEKVFLLVNVERKEAVSLYGKLGFSIVDSVLAQKMGDGQLHDEYRMEKVLGSRT
jgi:ribosomal protein S18 acetylase RimI-like enzyme